MEAQLPLKCDLQSRILVAPDPRLWGPAGARARKLWVVLREIRETVFQTFSHSRLSLGANSCSGVICVGSIRGTLPSSHKATEPCYVSSSLLKGNHVQSFSQGNLPRYVPQNHLKGIWGHMPASGRAGIAMQIPLTSCLSSSQKTKQNKKHNEEA